MVQMRYANKPKPTRRRGASGRSTAVALAFALAGALLVGGALALLVSEPGVVENRFEPGRVTTAVEEEVGGGVKSNVAISNTGNVEGYIRAAVAVTWQSDAGDVYGERPVSSAEAEAGAACDYEIAFSDDGSDGKAGEWVLAQDGFYYWTKPVKSGQESADHTTGYLVLSCEQAEGAQAPAEGYYLCVEILGSGIQSLPAEVVAAEWQSGVSAVSDDGTLTVKAA